MKGAGYETEISYFACSIDGMLREYTVIHRSEDDYTIYNANGKTVKGVKGQAQHKGEAG